MYDALKSRLATLLSQPRPMKPQTQRQLASHLSEHHTDMAPFLLCAAEVLEDYELDVLFSPLFTPSVEDRAKVADLLYHWRPTAAQIDRLVPELCETVPHAAVLLPDGSQAKLTIHEVMVDRFVRLLRLDAAPDAATSAALREALPPDLWPLGVALVCERGMTPRHQAWVAAFIGHVASHGPVSPEMLATAASFAASQPSLERESLISAGQALLRAAQNAASFARAGHTYWSPDVAQHHSYRGQGQVDADRLAQTQSEVDRLAALVEHLAGFEGIAGEPSPKTP